MVDFMKKLIIEIDLTKTNTLEIKEILLEYASTISENFLPLAVLVNSDKQKVGTVTAGN